MRIGHILLSATIFIAGIGQGQTTWYTISQPGVDFTITDENTGYRYINEPVGSHGYKYQLQKSSDVFQTFQTVLQNQGTIACYTLDGMFFIDSDTGFVAELCMGVTTIKRTTSGGQGWTSLGYGGLFGLIMYFLDKNTGYHGFMYPGPSYKSVLGKCGTTVFSSYKYLFGGAKFWFINDSSGFIICKDSLQHSVIVKTTDSGYHLTETFSLSNNTFRDMFFWSDSLGFVVGNNGIILRTTDSGEQWEIINSGTTNNLFSIEFSCDSVGYIAGEGGKILRSLDMGETWVPVDFINSNNLIYIRVFKGEHVYILDSGGTLFSNQYTVGCPDHQREYITVSHRQNEHAINISVPSGTVLSHVLMYDLLGRKILVTRHNEFSVNHLEEGIYILEVLTDQGSTRKKILLW